MKRGIVIVSVASALIGAFALGRAGAQEGADEMSAWMELAKPGPEHAALMKGVGTWNCEVKSWMKPGAEPTLSKGTAVRTGALDGRFVREEYEGTMMDGPYKGFGYMGFDNATRKYSFVWMDNWGTGMMVQTGTETEPGKVWEYKGSFFGPGGVEVKARSVIRKVSDDQTVMEMFNDMGMGERKCAEMTYTRAK